MGRGTRWSGREATVQITHRHSAVGAPWQREQAECTARQVGKPWI